MANTSSAWPPHRWAVVVPTVRPDQYREFRKAWDPVLRDAYFITVHDAETVPDWADGFSGEHHAWDTIGLTHHARRADMVRSWGFYKAFQHGFEHTLTLDDDVRPAYGTDLFGQYGRVFHDGAPCSPYLNVGALTTYGKPLRGFPYGDRLPAEVAVQYGGWDGVLDYDAPTQIGGVKDTEKFLSVVLPIPRGNPVTGCIMNCAFKTRYAPIMWQLPLLNGLYNRFGDIWSGLFQKKTLDMLGAVMVVNGKAKVRHVRASDPIANLEREAPGIPFNETLWEALRAEPGELVGVYRQVTNSAATHFPQEYSKHFLEARDEWLALF